MNNDPSSPAYGKLKAFPSLDLHAMVAALRIAAHERVLDVGGGGAPLPRADVVVERHLGAASDRDDLKAPLDHRWVAGDVQALPFADGSFDFVYCAHVLEHVNDPARACEELMRVGKRGYIETPRRLTEFLHGHPTHRWLVDVIDGVLVFERRPFIESPLRNVMLAQALKNEAIFQSYLVEQRHLSCVQFAWEGRFPYRVIEASDWRERFDYDNPIHAGWSHFYFAVNLLAQQAPVDYVAPHIQRAYERLPKEGPVVLLASILRFLQHDLAGASLLLQEATRLGCTDACMAQLHTLYQEPTAAAMLPLPMGRGVYPLPPREGREASPPLKQVFSRLLSVCAALRRHAP